jgi:ribonuclease D
MSTTHKPRSAQWFAKALTDAYNQRAAYDIAHIAIVKAMDEQTDTLIVAVLAEEAVRLLTQSSEMDSEVEYLIEQACELGYTPEDLA